MVSIHVKRLFDLVVSAVGLVLLTPVGLLIALAIKFADGGPVLYGQIRVGQFGKPFRIWKFRSMVRDADKLGLPLTPEADGRITPLGVFLRRFKLDELPQLWNVVKGDMSLVGPRPHPLDDVAGYEIEHLSRLDVTPGITGLWQVTARRDPSFQRGMELDREYIRTWSLVSDMRILLKTFLAVVQGSGD